MQRELTLILPTLNEQDNIVPQIREVLEHVPEILEILVVDDNSKDGTRSAIQENLAAELATGKIRLIHRTSDFGLTNSFREGIQKSRGNLVGWMDCDLSMPSSLLVELVKQIENGFDIAVGSRFSSGGAQKKLSEDSRDSRAEILLSNLLNGTLKTFLKLPITDYTSGFIVCRKETLKSIQLRGHHGEYFFDLILQAHLNGAKITEIPYQCGTRKFGQSKTFGSLKAALVNSFRYSWAVLRVLGEKATGFRAIPARH